LPKTDGRSIWARLMRETFECLLVHCGGADVVSETQRLIARRIGTLEAELVFMEDKFASILVRGTTMQFNPSFDAKVIARQLASDPQLYGAEYNSEWRDDLATFISRDLLEAALIPVCWCGRLWMACVTMHLPIHPVVLSTASRWPLRIWRRMAAWCSICCWSGGHRSIRMR
jgi:hypothetical protein